MCVCVCVGVCVGVFVSVKHALLSVLKATFGKRFRDWMERIIMGFSENADNHLELNCRLNV